MTSGCADEANCTEDLESFVFLSYPGPSDHTHSLEYTHSVGTHFSETAKDKTRLRSRLVSAWNNVKYGGWTMKSKPRLSKNSPVCLLGHTYDLSHEDERQRFRCVFSSLFWMTYRRGFSLAARIVSDLRQWVGLHAAIRPDAARTGASATHAACRLDLVQSSSPNQRRSGAQTLSAPCTWIGTEPEGGTEEEERGGILDEDEDEQERGHRRVVAWFGDNPGALFGLHRLVMLGQSSGQRAGDWYGPSVAAHILRKSVAESELHDLAVYVSQDCTVYIKDVMRLCEERSPKLPARFGPVLILVPVRLGGDALNPAYIPHVKSLLQLKGCVGIIGGKPKHSLYFVGFQDDQLLYLDPHFCQAAVDVNQHNFPLESFHCKTPRKLPFHRMDPSCTLGFYTKSRRDFEILRSEVTTALSSSPDMYPIFTFMEGCGHEQHKQHEQLDLSFDPERHVPPKDKGRRRSKRSSTDEFVVLCTPAKE